MALVLLFKRHFPGCLCGRCFSLCFSGACHADISLQWSLKDFIYSFLNEGKNLFREIWVKLFLKTVNMVVGFASILKTYWTFMFPLLLHAEGSSWFWHEDDLKQWKSWQMFCDASERVDFVSSLRQFAFVCPRPLQHEQAIDWCISLAAFQLWWQRTVQRISKNEELELGYEKAQSFFFLIIN